MTSYRFRHQIVVSVFLVLGTGHFAEAQQNAIPTPAPAIAFVNANLIRMDTERVEAGQTALVTDDRIAIVTGSAAAQLTEGTTIIDASGRYLVPGLADAHVHLTTDMPWAPARPDFGASMLASFSGRPFTRLVSSSMNLG